jgi:FAD synthetase
MKGKSVRGPVRVFVGGTFDGLHLGHAFLLQFARRRGLALAKRQGRPGVHVSVVIARDESVRRIKGTPAQHSEQERRRLVVPNNFVRSVRRVDPDLVVLGYDQRGDWERILAEAGIEAKVVRCPAYEPDRLKSSVLRGELEKMAT